jgi:hypothetical protein
MNVKAETAKRPLPRSDAGRKKTLEKRLALADELANTPTTTLTLRLPVGMNQWLDAYVHGVWQTKVRKQELVIEAMRLLIARRGAPNEDVLATDFLAEK